MKRKKIFPAPKNANASPRFDIDEIDEPTLDYINNLLEAPYWHDRIRKIFMSAGFATRWLQRHTEHPIWEIYLKRVSFNLARKNAAACEQIRKLLNEGGINVESGQFNIVSRNQDIMRCVFMSHLGCPGIWRQNFLRLTQGDLLPEFRQPRKQANRG